MQLLKNGAMELCINEYHFIRLNMLEFGLTITCVSFVVCTDNSKDRPRGCVSYRCGDCQLDDLHILGR